ncbi:hypothetical protein LSUE1_G007121 [Lachnellula suecica]|uniref:Rhodopsin domain-containing protein n=1 Tax=Lachnellula suecica TaxID=602035 RepID=A0A8T9C7P3_9HELO|nr:hypothetical protein LSUE1_G007121 [Lachnellula suecica]
MHFTGVTRGAQVTGIAVMALSLTWISALLRSYVRIRILKFVGRQDWLMLAAMLLLTILCSLFLSAINYGLGAHMYNILPEGQVTGFKIIFNCELLYVVTTAVTKLSIGAYFLRLSSRKYQIRVVYTTLAVVMVFSTMYFFFLLFQCTPINYLWTQFSSDDIEGSCLRSPILANVTYAHAAMSAITDWAFGILPIFFVWGMQMNPRTKFSVVLILSLGFFASSATIVRFVYIRTLADTDDWSWEGINLVKWSMVEPAIAITASNIATLRPMFKSFVVFASKRFDSKINDEERWSADSRLRLRKNQHSNSAKLYSPEFADLLGLSRVGVTTKITAGGSDPETPKSRRKFSLALLNKEKNENESQTELNDGTNFRKGSDGMDWSSGIRTTTVIMVDR